MSAGPNQVRTLKPNEMLFNDNDPAESLYIIKSGQIRLFKPKGRGFVEIAILRAGEVIGEMAYFDKKQRRRSAAAQAIVTTQIAEITFKNFAKTMSGMNPWFKIIVHTLADRLRSTNDRVKQLESNSVGFGKDGKVANYVFFHNIDIVRLFSVFYMVFKTFGSQQGEAARFVVSLNNVKLYATEIFNVQEVKFIEFLEILKTESLVELTNDKDGNPTILATNNVDRLRILFNFFNSQRLLTDEKQIKISPKCQTFLNRILEQLVKKGFKPQKNEKGEIVETAKANISSILNDFKEKNAPIFKEDLDDAVSEGLVSEVVVDKGGLLVSDVHYEKLRRTLPAVKMLNAIKKVNEVKAREGGY